MKKGFTLIELLAVIAIIAVIALITAPAVLDLLSGAKESAVVITAQKYSKTLSSTILTKKMKEAINPYKCTITSDGNAECYDKETGISKLIEIETTDNVSGGFIEFDENAITDYTFCIDGNSVTKDGTVNKNSTYCKNLNDPNAAKYTAKFYVNNTEYKTKNNYDYLLNDYIGFVEGSNELKLPDIPLDKSILDDYDIPVEYWWYITNRNYIYYEDEHYVFEAENANFIPTIRRKFSGESPWYYKDWATNGDKKNIKGSTVYSGIKKFKLEPGVDDYAYEMVPFYDGTTYTYSELNTTYKDTEFAIISMDFGLNTEEVIGTGVNIFVGDYLDPDVTLYNKFFLIDPNSNDDYIASEVVLSLGDLRDPLTIQEALDDDPYKETYDAVRVVRLVIPYNDYIDKNIHIVVTYRDTSGLDYDYLYKNDTLSRLLNLGE